MFDILRDYLQWQTRLDILFERAKHVVPLKARSEKMMKSRQVQVMIDYKTKEVWNRCPHKFGLQLSTSTNLRLVYKTHQYQSNTLKTDNGYCSYHKGYYQLRLPGKVLSSLRGYWSLNKTSNKKCRCQFQGFNRPLCLGCGFICSLYGEKLYAFISLPVFSSSINWALASSANPLALNNCFFHIIVWAERRAAGYISG